MSQEPGDNEDGEVPPMRQPTQPPPSIDSAIYALVNILRDLDNASILAARLRPSVIAGRDTVGNRLYGMVQAEIFSHMANRETQGQYVAGRILQRAVHSRPTRTFSIEALWRHLLSSVPPQVQRFFEHRFGDPLHPLHTIIENFSRGYVARFGRSLPRIGYGDQNVPAGFGTIDSMHPRASGTIDAMGPRVNVSPPQNLPFLGRLSSNPPEMPLDQELANGTTSSNVSLLVVDSTRFQELSQLLDRRIRQRELRGITNSFLDGTADASASLSNHVATPAATTVRSREGSVNSDASGRNLSLSVVPREYPSSWTNGRPLQDSDSRLPNQPSIPRSMIFDPSGQPSVSARNQSPTQVGPGPTPWSNGRPLQFSLFSRNQSPTQASPGPASWGNGRSLQSSFDGFEDSDLQPSASMGVQPSSDCPPSSRSNAESDTTSETEDIAQQSRGTTHISFRFSTLLRGCIHLVLVLASHVHLLTGGSSRGRG